LRFICRIEVDELVILGAKRPPSFSTIREEDDAEVIRIISARRATTFDRKRHDED
jgi:uncharacterized DUF497 family protein